MPLPEKDAESQACRGKVTQLVHRRSNSIVYTVFQVEAVTVVFCALWQYEYKILL